VDSEYGAIAQTYFGQVNTYYHSELESRGPRTAEEFDRADRASRLVKAESLTEFCREAILERAEGILAEKSRGGR
jgi:hypothetical protein